MIVRADVAQLVAHHLAKVDVAERRGSGLQILLHGFKSRLHLKHDTSDEKGMDWQWS